MNASEHRRPFNGTSVPKNPPKKNQFPCPTCSQVFSKKIYLHQHKKIHGPKKFKCQHCSKAFIRKYDTFRHERTHSTPQNKIPRKNLHPSFPCDYCPKIFKKLAWKSRHERRSHRKYTKSDENGSSRVIRTRQQSFEVVIKQEPEDIQESLESPGIVLDHNPNPGFKCPMCPRAFKVMHEFRRHCEYHKSGILLPCPLCPVFCWSQKRLDIHLEKAHGWEKYEICAVCDRFIDLAFLRRMDDLQGKPSLRRNEVQYVCRECETHNQDAIAAKVNNVVQNGILVKIKKEPGLTETPANDANGSSQVSVKDKKDNPALKSTGTTEARHGNSPAVFAGDAYAWMDEEFNNVSTDDDDNTGDHSSFRINDEILKKIKNAPTKNGRKVRVIAFD